LKRSVIKRCSNPMGTFSCIAIVMTPAMLLLWFELTSICGVCWLAYWFYRFYRLRNLIDRLSDIGIIAGGSIVYAVCDDVDTYGDIDIFVNKRDAIVQVYKMLRELGSVEVNVHGSVFNMKMGGVVFQVIYCSHGSVSDVLDNFCLDYVKCAYYKRKLTIDDTAMVALESMTIVEVNPYTKVRTLLKARRKGFALSAAHELITLTRDIENVPLLIPVSEGDVVERIRNVHVFDNTYMLADKTVLPTDPLFNWIRTDRYELLQLSTGTHKTTSFPIYCNIKDYFRNGDENEDKYGKHSVFLFDVDQKYKAIYNIMTRNFALTGMGGVLRAKCPGIKVYPGLVIAWISFVCMIHNPRFNGYTSMWCSFNPVEATPELVERVDRYYDQVSFDDVVNKIVSHSIQE